MNTSTTNKANFRPTTFADLIGQEEAKEYLQIKVAAFKKTGMAPGHILFLGPSGIGKTTISMVMANELGVGFHEVMANAITRWDDLLEILIKVKENDVVFIDELHALPSKIQENLYGVMEDFKFDQHDAYFGTTQKISLPRFTLIGATTHAGDINAPLLSRFQYKPNLMPYTVEQLTLMANTAANRIYGISLPSDVALRLAQLSRKTARQCYNLLTNLMEMAEAKVTGQVKASDLNIQMLDHLLRLIHLDPIIGLDYVQRKYLVTLLRERTAIGLKPLASLINEQETTISGVVEPFLMSEVEFTFSGVDYEGQLARPTKRGRLATETAAAYIRACKTLQKDGYFANESLSI